MTCPVMKLASSETRKATTAATSAGPPILPSANAAPAAARCSAVRYANGPVAVLPLPLPSSMPQRRLNLPEPLGDGIGFRDGQPGHLTPPGAALLERARDVEMHMGHGLIGGGSVVLPDRDAGPHVRRIDNAGRMTNLVHEHPRLLVPQVEDRRAVPDGHHQQMRHTPLLPRDQDGHELTAPQDGVRLLPPEERAERAALARRQHDVTHTTHDAVWPPVSRRRRLR